MADAVVLFGPAPKASGRRTESPWSAHKRVSRSSWKVGFAPPSMGSFPLGVGPNSISAEYPQ